MDGYVYTAFISALGGFGVGMLSVALTIWIKGKIRKRKGHGFKDSAERNLTVDTSILESGRTDHSAQDF